MSFKKKSTAELGRFKEAINTALFNSDEIKDLLLGDTSGKSKAKILEDFKYHVKSHLFIDDTIEATDTFIFYDVAFVYMHSNIKTCRVIMYAICHRDIIDNYFSDNYVGNRVDILSQMIEEALLNDEAVVNKFGIGELTMMNNEPYNSNRFYGRTITFTVPDFR